MEEEGRGGVVPSPSALPRNALLEHTAHHFRDNVSRACATEKGDGEPETVFRCGWWPFHGSAEPTTVEQTKHFNGNICPLISRDSHNCRKWNILKRNYAEIVDVRRKLKDNRRKSQWSPTYFYIFLLWARFLCFPCRPAPAVYTNVKRLINGGRFRKTCTKRVAAHSKDFRSDIFGTRSTPAAGRRP